MVRSGKGACVHVFLSGDAANLSSPAHQCLGPEPLREPTLDESSGLWEAYEALLGDDRVVLRAEEPAGLETHWERFAVCDTASPKLWMDAFLAAFALAGGYRMVTTDAAFKQFRGLDLELLGE